MTSAVTGKGRQESPPERKVRLRTIYRSSALTLAVVMAAGFCIYRINTFTPLPLDSPGTLRPLLYEWFRSYTGFFRSTEQAWLFWHEVCYALLVSFPLLALFNFLRRKTVQQSRMAARILLSRSFFWLLYAICLILCRYPVLLRNELNPDEGQFLAGAYKLFYDPNFFHSVDCQTSGPGNVFPLMAPAIFGLSPDFASGRIIGLIALFFCVYLLYRALELVIKDERARIAILPVALAFPTFSNAELVYNSSEHIPLLLISLALFLAVRIFIRPAEYRLPLFLLGLTCSVAFFTKIQSAPIIAAPAAVSLGYLFANSYKSTRWRALLFTACGVAVPVLVNTALCLKAGVLRDFWNSYILANVEYSESSVSFNWGLWPFMLWAVKTPELCCFFLAVLVIAVASLARKLSASLKPAFGGDRGISGAAVEQAPVAADPVRWLGWLALLSSAAAFFSVYKPHRTFIHYFLFVFVPVGMTVGWMLVREVGRTRILPWLTVGITLLAGSYLWNFQGPRGFDVPAMIRAPEGDFIRMITSPGSKIYVWGWTARPYLASGRIPATRQTLVGTLFRGYNVMTFPPVIQPTPDSKRIAAFYRRRELSDLEANPPELFIDAIGPASWFLSSRDYYGFERVPEIANFVNKHYVHLVDLYEERYFLRKDVAARRNAEFSQPLPLKRCAPGAVVCLNTAVTLPRDLPAVHLPTRAKIEAEFMPIGRQIGVATVFNNEARPNSFRGLRLQHVAENRYILLAGLGGRWAVSHEFGLPEGKIAFLTIKITGHNLTIENDGSKLEELPLADSIADSPGPINIGSWIGGMDPFSGKIQFFEIVDLNK